MNQPVSQLPIFGDELEKQLLENSKCYVYKQTDHGDLRLYMFYPETFDPDELLTTVVFFHGGLWDQSMISQFAPQCHHFASRNAIGVCVEYRVSKKHEGSDPTDAIRDAQTAILWLRQNHSHLNIDPHKIIAGGGGSGAHLALCAALHKKIERDELYDARPDALIIYSGIVNTTKKGVSHSSFSHKKSANRTSPLKNVRRKSPPAIFFHGKQDPIAPLTDITLFVKKYKNRGNHAVFSPYDRATHSFFNFNVSKDHFVHTIDSADGFLTRLGFLNESETVIGSI